MYIISPSILSCDFSRMGEEIERTGKTDAEYIHIDVMDGNFVPNLTFGPPVIRSLRRYTDKVFDVHLMIVEPIRYIDDYRKAGADIITVHIEACSDLRATLEKIRASGARVGLSVKPKTDPALIAPYLPLVDMILVMTVEPGFGGQSFIEDTLKNIRKVRRMIDRQDRSVLLEVDGGITVDTIGRAAKAGAEVFVAGSAVYKKPDIGEAVKELLRAAGQH